MMPTRRVSLAALAVLALMPARAQQTGTVNRFRGTIDSVSGRTLELTTLSGGKVTVSLPPGTRVTVATAGSLSDIKPGSYIGSAARTLPDGTLEALEVHVFSEALRGTAEGHYGWDLGPESTMTNGTVGSAVGTSGRRLTVDYPDGRQTITVPPDVPVVLTSEGSWSDVKPGAAAVLVTSQANDGAVTVVFMTVGRNGVHPPM